MLKKCKERPSIVSFYRGGEIEKSHKAIHSIWDFSTFQLEHNHNYIQWLFPLDEESKYTKNVPILTEETIQEMKANYIIMENVLQSFKIMLQFYGFCMTKQINEDSGEVERLVEIGEDFTKRSNHWIKRNNHNFLRITRILRCMTLLGFNSEAIALFNALEVVYKDEKYAKKIGTETYKFWKNAVS